MRFEHRSTFRCTPDQLFAFHERADALPLLTPPWAGVQVIQAAPNLQVGAEAILRVPIIPPLRTTWHARHTVYEPPHRFVDEQISGPFQSWRHEHIINPHQDGAELIDRIDFEPPLGVLGRLAAPLFIRPMLARMFRYRHAVTKRELDK